MFVTYTKSCALYLFRLGNTAACCGLRDIELIPWTLLFAKSLGQHFCHSCVADVNVARAMDRHFMSSFLGKTALSAGLRAVLPSFLFCISQM